MSSGPVIIEAEELAPGPRAWLAERAEVVSCPQHDRARFERLIVEAEGLLVRTYTRVDQVLLSGAPRLRVVGRAGAGLDNIDVEGCVQRGVAVVHTPEANADAVTEFVVGLMTDAVRPRRFLEHPLGREAWDAVRAEVVTDRQIGDLTLGVWGHGRVGSRVARVGGALGMRVIYHDVLDIPPDRRFGKPVGREELLRTSDILSVHVDPRAGNEHLIDAPALSLVRPNLVLINTSRGFVIDNFSLAEFMLSHPGARAMLDVHRPEPFDETYPLLDIGNIRLTPHMAAATKSAKTTMSWVVRDVWRVLSGERPEFLAVEEASR